MESAELLAKLLNPVLDVRRVGLGALKGVALLQDGRRDGFEDQPIRRCRHEGDDQEPRRRWVARSGE